jgi:hypothetical protein
LVLKNSILNKSFQIRTEEIAAIDKPQIALISYKNIPTLYYRLIEVDESKESAMSNYYGDELISYLTISTAKKSGTWTLPDEKDYQNHSLEVAVPAMPNGRYILLVSYDKDFKMEKGNAINYTTYDVSSRTMLATW